MSKLKFAILADKSDKVISELEMLKQNIRSLPCGPQSGGRDKGQIKLEKGMGLKGVENKLKNKKGKEVQRIKGAQEIQKVTQTHSPLSLECLEQPSTGE